MKLLEDNKILLFGLAAAAAVGIFVVVSNKSDSSTTNTTATVNNTPPTEQPTKPPVKLLAERSLSFGGSGSNPKLSVYAPVGWAKADDTRVDLIIGALTPEKLADGSQFVPNINFIIGPHELKAKSIDDYVASWKETILGSYPSMSAVNDYKKKVGDLDVYALEMIQTKENGLVLHQVQYVYWLNKDFVLAATATAPDSIWSKYEPVFTASLSSLVLESLPTDNSSTPSAGKATQ